ncbi:MAG TPA: lipoyl(octanoyl) transferase LipB [bacterium]|jgi:lipoyl(octanoyl) transferase|nr:lipoyl(octanoyl) transferase LipB [bacterium]MDX9805822.1 lipoyl(octanoyl) transferase LipB [bacterium]HNW15759.1 lipoyl(octanoyl) transferase LipB [bacterium]HNZ54410.1 lipoyl(octanoyl) transferase LipB [bacterium]HOB71125.1 lipoyl(octanoyl) transferase LipB [bacterium]
MKYVIMKGFRDYGTMLALQEKTREEIVAGDHQGVIYFLEHAPVYTSGLRGTEDQILKPLNGVPVFNIRRGGELTWHGPGQLVVYPVIDIRYAGFASIREFVNFFGTAIEKVLSGFCGIENAKWNEEKAGVWVDDRKIAFSGLHFRKFIPIHGYSVNIYSDIQFFNSIIPCGMPNCRITSAAIETGREFSIEDVAEKIAGIIKEKIPCLEKSKEVE